MMGHLEYLFPFSDWK